MAQAVLVLITLITTCTCFIVFGVYTVKSVAWKATGQDATFPGAGIFYSSPAQVTEKYPLSIYPAPWAISIIWPIVLLWNVAAMVYLFYRSLSTTKFLQLPPKMFYCWTGAWFLTTVWTFLFDGEYHLGTLTVVFFVLAFGWYDLVISCKVYRAYTDQLVKETRSERATSHPFRYLVVEGLAILSMWSCVAFAISIGYALAYRQSLHSDTAILTGILTPEESATMGAIFILVCFVIWWTLDVAYWGGSSDCIQSIYPAFALVMLSLGLSNYSKDRGITLNNALCFGPSALSLILMLTRSRVKRFFLQDQYKPDATVNVHLE